ncbi:hypothetical protein HY375_01420 [Candidatus Berkelbacteria bacterium]|nr:hypothetical protein [Candidatus Berkelbacteria bacterium]
MSAREVQPGMWAHLGPVLIGLALFVICLPLNLSYFESSSPLFSGDDPAVHLTVVKSLVNGTPIDASIFPGEHYRLPISLTHRAAASLATTLGTDPIQTFKVMLVVIYTTVSLLAFFLLVRPLGLHWAFVASAFLNFLFLFQELFWGGNFNQIVGLALVFGTLLTLDGLVRAPTWRSRLGYLIGTLLLLALTARVHDLTFFLLGVIVAVVTIGRLIITAQRPWVAGGALAALLVGLPLAFTRAPGNFGLMQEQISLLQFPIPPVFGTAEAGAALLTTLMLTGLVYLANRRAWPLVVALVVTMLLATAGNSTEAFFPYRILGYAAPLLILALVAGGAALASFLRPPGQVAIAFFVLIFGLLYFRQTSLIYRATYQGESSLPARIPEADVSAMSWIRDHTPPDAIVGGAFKWGAYIPVYADRPVYYYPDAVIGFTSRPALQEDIRTMMAGESAKEQAEASQRLGVDYILWGKQLAEDRHPYFKRIEYQNHFTDPEYFEEVYHHVDGTTVYRVR